MILRTAYSVSFPETGSILFSDNSNLKCGLLFKLADDHTDKAVMNWFLEAHEQRDLHAIAISDLDAYVTMPLPESMQHLLGRKKAFSAALSLMLEDRGVDFLQIGSEIGEDGKSINYWLVMIGMQETTRVPLKRVIRRKGAEA